MKNIFKFAFTLGLVASLAVGCIKETFPQGGSATNDQFLGNNQAFESLVRGIPGYLMTPLTHTGTQHYELGYPAMMTIREMLSNDVAINNIGYEWFGSWHENTYQGENYIYGQYIWNFYSECVMNANKVIAFDSEENNSVIRNMIGSAYAYRAMFWLDMGQMYEFKPNNYTSKPIVEGLTIPHMHENLTEDEARNNPRLPKAELVELIRADLNKAIEYTHGQERMGIQLPNEAVAYGLLARLEMWNEDYEAAKAAAQKAIELSGCTPLTEAQWTSTSTGFNDVASQKSWMLAMTLTDESPAVKTGIINHSSWFCSETSFGYCGAGAFRMADANFYSMISDKDFRKKSWKAPEGSKLDVPMIPEGTYYDPSVLPDLAGIKFRPANGNTDDYLVGAVSDLPLMRVEEMYFIIAECDARNGDPSSLYNFMTTYRNPSYNIFYEGEELVSEVLFQKRVEFWMEGIVFFDYKRCPEYVEIYRGYPGTNHYPECQYNVDGLAPWMNICYVMTETNQNPALINNPDPSQTVPYWDGK